MSQTCVHFCLKPDFSSFYNQSFLHDCILIYYDVVDGVKVEKRLYGHRFVLAQMSTYFHDYLTCDNHSDGLRDNKPVEIKNDVNYGNTFEILIKAIYGKRSQEMEINDDLKLLEIYETAQYYDVESLRGEIIRIFSSKTTTLYQLKDLCDLIYGGNFGEKYLVFSPLLAKVLRSHFKNPEEYSKFIDVPMFLRAMEADKRHKESIKDAFKRFIGNYFQGTLDDEKKRHRAQIIKFFESKGFDSKEIAAMEWLCVNAK